MSHNNLEHHKNNALILAHFHSRGRIRTDTLNFLNECKGRFNKLILVSTNLNEDEKRRIPEYVDLFVRENVGYDFFSYRHGLLKIAQEILFTKEICQVTLMNTSFIIYDPKKLLQEYYEIIDSNDDFCGLTMYTGQGLHPHLQSYLLTFNKKVLNDPRFLDWWKRMAPSDNKAELIQGYEVGLSVFLNKLGYRAKSIFPIYTNDKYADPMHGRFMEILETFSILKIGLFTTNPFNLSLRDINSKIRQDSYFHRLIVEGLEN